MANIRCAHCKSRHTSVAEVKACSRGTRMPDNRAGSEAFNREWAEWKNLAARREAEQERAAYLAEAAAEQLAESLAEARAEAVADWADREF